MVVGLGRLQTLLFQSVFRTVLLQGWADVCQRGRRHGGVCGAAGVQYCLLVFVYGMGGGWC